MKTSKTIDLLSKAFVSAQADLKNATFDKVNLHFKNKYATLAGMRDSIAPALAKHGLAVIQGTAEKPSGFTVSTRLIHQSGQWIESEYPLPLGEPQKMGSAYTYARRYSLAAICGIASEEDDDGNATNEKPKENGLASLQGSDAASKGHPTDQSKTPKAEARPEYAKISNGIKTITQTGNIEDLRRWFKSNSKTIEGFDQGWNALIMKEFDDAKATLNSKVAA